MIDPALIVAIAALLGSFGGIVHNWASRRDAAVFSGRDSYLQSIDRVNALAERVQEQSDHIAEQDARVAAQAKQIKEQDERLTSVTTQLTAITWERDLEKRRADRLEAELAAAKRRILELEREVALFRTGRSLTEGERGE